MLHPTNLKSIRYLKIKTQIDFVLQL